MPNKEHAHPALYLLSLLCIFGGIACIGFIIYTIPHTVFGLKYNVPLIVEIVKEWYEAHYTVAGSLQLFFLYLPIALMAVLFFLAASYLDQYLETHHEPGVPDVPPVELDAHKTYKEYRSLIGTSTISHPTILIVLGIVLFLAFVALITEYLLILR